MAPDGPLAYVEAAATAERTLVWVNQKGEETPLETKAGPFSHPRLSPDGNRVILAYRNDATEDLWMHDISRSVTERFVAEPASEWSADWTADGDRVVFTSRRDGPFQLFSKRANGLGDIERVAHSEGAATILGRDGKDFLILSRGVGRLDLTTGTSTPLWREPSIGEAELSPDRQTRPGLFDRAAQGPLRGSLSLRLRRREGRPIAHDQGARGDTRRRTPHRARAQLAHRIEGTPQSEMKTIARPKWLGNCPMPHAP